MIGRDRILRMDWVMRIDAGLGIGAIRCAIALYAVLFHWRKGRLIPLWQPARVSGYWSQVRFFRRLFPNARGGGAAWL